MAAGKTKINLKISLKLKIHTTLLTNTVPQSPKNHLVWISYFIILTNESALEDISQATSNHQLHPQKCRGMSDFFVYTKFLTKENRK
jgi:hypothetical protein